MCVNRSQEKKLFYLIAKQLCLCPRSWKPTAEMREFLDALILRETISCLFLDFSLALEIVLLEISALAAEEKYYNWAMAGPES